MTISNKQGRALEYCVAARLQKAAKQRGIRFSFTTRALKDNKRDKEHFYNVESILRDDFQAFAATVAKWFFSKPFSQKLKFIQLDRFPDRAGVEGDVTDMELTLESEGKRKKRLHFSIKHHHDALKHPRIPRLLDHCGAPEAVSKKFMAEHDLIWEKFIRKAKQLSPNATSFSEVNKSQKDAVSKYLYAPLNRLVIKYLRKYSNFPENASSLFVFIVGNQSHYVLKNEKDNVVIKHFFNIKSPSSFGISIIRDNTFAINFDNGWQVSFRLHTASSRMYTKTGKLHTSVKYDVQPPNLDGIIKIEQMPKHPKL